MQPTDHMSTAVEYSCGEKNKHHVTLERGERGGEGAQTACQACVYIQVFSLNADVLGLLSRISVILLWAPLKVAVWD